MQVQTDGLTVDQFKSLIREAVREEFTACGLLSTTPEHQVEAQADFKFLRQWRKSYDGIVNKVGTAVVMAVLAAIGSLIAIGFNFKFGGH